MSISWSARRDRRTIQLTQQDGVSLTLPLDQGGRYRVVVQENPTAREIIEELEALPDVGILVAGGGLLGARTVAENFAIALHYGTDSLDNVTTEWEDVLRNALQLAGMPEARIASIGRELPMNLSRTERWLLGFVRCLLRPPELLVFDRIFSGLTRREAEALVTLENLYHDYHPFRPVLFVDLDTHELPAVSDCVKDVRCTEDACLS